MATVMNTTEEVVIRGIAHRGDCDPEIAKFVADATPISTSLPLYPQLHQHTTIGTAEVTMQDNGDVTVEAAIPIVHAPWIIGHPFLSLTIDDPEDGPRQIVQTAITDCVLDSFQLPYRIVTFPAWMEQEFLNFYEPAVVIDEAHMAALNLNSDGSVIPIFDQKKTHIELRHRTEKQRLRMPDAVARGCGYESWDEIADKDDLTGTRAILREVLGVL